MIFESIKLQNFRQYKHTMEFNFSAPDVDEKNITLIVAANGVGKTTLLQAFRYCFYGASSNYLNLPKSDELVNNTLVHELKDLDESVMFVEVRFEHENVHYIARREQNYQKIRGSIRHHGEEVFTLASLTEGVGYKPFRETQGLDKIKSILPDGLSQVFMFDGERMETNISDPKFSSELQESILGILGIKKYAKLIDVIGHPGKASSVIGLLTSKKKTDSEEDRKIKHQHDDLTQKLDGILDDINDINTKLEAIEHQININKDQQKKLQDNRVRVVERNQLEDFIKDSEERLDLIATNYIKVSREALIYKHVLQYTPKFNEFVNQGRTDTQFYDLLHVDTIEDVIRKGTCICGRPVGPHSQEMEVLTNLKRHALPLEAAQHLNLINQRIRKALDYKDSMDQLTRLKHDMVDEKLKKDGLIDKLTKLNKKIFDVEQELGLSNQKNIDELMDNRDRLKISLGAKQQEKETLEKLVNKLQTKINKIDQNSGYNRQINRVIHDVITIKEKLEKIKRDLDEKARQVLSNHFDRNLSKTLQGRYQVQIDERYRIKIVDMDSNNDVTSTLSTGQNVVISLTFISALIQTARDMSSTINKNEHYGVIMDAAMSNLDERHIDRLSRYNLINMDQLIFLSFKRQLRHEMYYSIQDNIGKSYYLTKNSQGAVKLEELSTEQLSSFIHQTEADE
jgi:DNA sulfur modification protein DndD